MPRHFPHDIIPGILTKLPVTSLLRFKGVSKPWNSLITDRKFIKQHSDTCIRDKNCLKYFLTSCGPKREQYYYYTIDHPLHHDSNVNVLEPSLPSNQLRVVSGRRYYSSNGLLLMMYPDDRIILWNPATRESRIIPSPILKIDGRWFGGIYNFCYVPSIDGYKIFRAVGTDFLDDRKDEVEIFSTKVNSWKSIGPFPPNYYHFGGYAVIADGVVYMIARRKNLLNRDQEITIVRFCLEKEQFQEELLFPSPYETMEDPSLHARGETLCLTKKLFNYNSMQSYEVWEYMKTNGLSYSWSKILTIELTHFYPRSLLTFMEDGDMLFWDTDFKFLVYNSRGRELEKVNVARLAPRLHVEKHQTYEETFGGVVTYVETLFSPYS